MALAMLATSAAAVGLSPGPAAAEPSGGCRPIGGTATATGGPSRATVVVDPGQGPVWSACISFSGTISGLDALELATATIPGLDPLYESYTGQGRAVCRLLGVGNDPPNCLSKSVEYWAYFRNGEYARGGGGASVVADGDIEGWSFSRGTAPRPATQGTEAVAASAMPTAPPPTTPPPPAPPASTAPDGVPAPTLGGDQPDSSEPDLGSTTVPADGETGTSSAVPSPDEADGSASEPGGTDADTGTGTGSDGSGSGGLGRTTVTESEDRGSSLGSMIGFGAALGAVGVTAVLARRRRISAADAVRR